MLDAARALTGAGDSCVVREELTRYAESRLNPTVVGGRESDAWPFRHVEPQVIVISRFWQENPAVPSEPGIRS